MDDRTIIHNDHELFGLPSSFATNAKLRMLKNERDIYENFLSQANINVASLSGFHRGWAVIAIVAKENIDELNRRMKYLRVSKNKKNDGETLDIAFIKQIPIDTLVNVNAAGFFKVRNEKTASCKWYKHDNTWVDFGGDNRKHDVIDLVMLLNKCTFMEACKILS